METYHITKEGTEKFLKEVMNSFELFAPLKKGVPRFWSIKDAGQLSQLYFEKNTYFPVKEYFFRKREVLFKFKGNKIVQPTYESPKRVFFGIRRCDLNAIKHQDMVYNGQIKDPYYIAQRENTYLIGYHCNTAPSKYCFCGTLNLADFYDLMFYDRGDHYLVEVGSEKGKVLLEKYKKHFLASESIIQPAEKKIPGADRLLKDDIAGLYDHPDWQKGVNQCLSCAACTTLCPTCYCHEIHDEVTAKDPTAGSRVRSWSSCQVKDFTEVAGGHIFREKREERFKHRIYHQLEYFKEKNGVNLCVGCGRCIEGCPTRIDFVEIINEMK